MKLGGNPSVRGSRAKFNTCGDFPHRAGAASGSSLDAMLSRRSSGTYILDFTETKRLGEEGAMGRSGAVVYCTKITFPIAFFLVADSQCDILWAVAECRFPVVIVRVAIKGLS